jgi:uncharacterized protein (DUF3084 family)
VSGRGVVLAHAQTLQLEDYKTTLQSLNGRLKFYIDEIRARDETIVELNALLFKLKQSHVAELDRIDTQYKSLIQVMETKVGQVHQQDVQRLQQLVAKAQADFGGLSHPSRNCFEEETSSLTSIS